MRFWHFVPVGLASAAIAFAQPAPVTTASAHRSYVGFDRNDYPGDDQLPALRKQFDFVGYWLTNPPNTNSNSWVGKRNVVLQNGFGFAVLANGRIDQEILSARKKGKAPAALAREDATAAAAAAKREGFPPGTILFLDQEEGGRLLAEQAEYLLGWTEAIARTAYKPGVYASGKPVDDGKGPNGKPQTITTIQDIREHVAKDHLHPVAFWVIQDACPPAPGCVVNTAHPPSPDLSGVFNADAWQYAQSPQEKDLTRACTASYTAGNCYAPGIPRIHLDLSVATSADPSHGR